VILRILLFLTYGFILVAVTYLMLLEPWA
jgi:hypothetical protein